MVQRYVGEIHLNPIRVLRNDDFNNDGHIADISDTLDQAIEITVAIQARLQQFRDWVDKAGLSARYAYEPGGFISVTGLSDAVLQELAARDLIALYDRATEKDWVKKYGMLYGLIWQEGRAVDVADL